MKWQLAVLLICLWVTLVAAQDPTTTTTTPPPVPAPAPATPPAAATNATPPAQPSSTCVRCDTVPVASCPECPSGQICVYVARTCGQCARKECRAAEAVGASAPDAVNVSASSNTTMWIIIGCCAAGTIAVLAAAGFVIQRRRSNQRVLQQQLTELEKNGLAPTGLVVQDLEDQDLLDELGVDPLGTRVRIRSSFETHRVASGLSPQGVANAPTSIFEPPMTKPSQPWRRSTESSIYSSSPQSVMLDRGVASLDIERLQKPGMAKDKNPSRLRINTSVAAGGARSKDSLDRARAATSDLARLSKVETLLPDPKAPADDAILRLPGQGSSLLPQLSPSMSRFSFASINSGVENGLGVKPYSSRTSIVPPPASPVPAHPPPSIPLPAALDNSNGEARRVDEWWRASMNARSTIFDEQGRPVSMAYSDASSHADSVVQIAAARVAGLQPVVGSLAQVRTSRLPTPHGGADANAAHNAFIALSQRRTEQGGSGDEPPTGSVYGMM